jgi:CheY-like chemotaxis protein
VLLIDMVLPGGDVATLIRHLRAHPAFRETPLIVLSGEGSGGPKGPSDLPQDLCVIHKASLLQALPAALDATLADPAR